MKRYTQAFLILLITSLSVAQAQNPPAAIIDSANINYAEGNYQKAIENYNMLIERGYKSADLYYNLGNAYYKTNNITYAIVNYERAARLDPSDQAIAYNLQLAQGHVVDKIEHLPDFFLVRWVKAVRAALSADQWAITSLVVFTLSLLLFLGYLFATRIGLRKAGFWSAFVLMLVAIISFLFSLYNKQEVLTQDEAIIYTPSVTVKSAPDNSGTDLFMIHEGTKVELVDSLGNWFEIRIPDGNQGWLKRNDFIRI